METPARPTTISHEILRERLEFSGGRRDEEIGDSNDGRYPLDESDSDIDSFNSPNAYAYPADTTEIWNA